MIFEIALSLFAISYLFFLWITFKKHEDIKYYLKKNYLKEYNILKLGLNWKEIIIGDPSTTKTILKSFLWMINFYKYYSDNELRKKKIIFCILFFFSNIYFICGMVLFYFILMKL